MSFPERVYFTVHDTAARWGCSIAEIAGWADAGKLKILTGIVPVHCGEEIIGGKVELSPMELLPLFRRCGSGPSCGMARRIRPVGRKDWLLITDPADGVPVATADLLIMTSDIRDFEARHPRFGLPGRAGPSDDGDFDWVAMNTEIVRRVYEEGLPRSQGDWVRELQDWFSERTEDGKFPDERSIRRRLNPILRAVRFKHPKR
jgi:hypothetical protein